MFILHVIEDKGSFIFCESGVERVVLKGSAVYRLSRSNLNPFQPKLTPCFYLQSAGTSTWAGSPCRGVFKKKTCMTWAMADQRSLVLFICHLHLVVLVHLVGHVWIQIGVSVHPHIFPFLSSFFPCSYTSCLVFGAFAPCSAGWQWGWGSKSCTMFSRARLVLSVCDL